MPGDSNADLMMFLMVLTPMLKASRQVPAASISVVVDDIQLLALGGGKQAGSYIAEASEVISHQLEAESMLPLSDSKWKVLTSSERTFRTAALAYPRLRSKRSTHVRNLGIDFALVRQARRTVRMGRLRLARQRANKLRRVRLTGTRTLASARAAIQPLMDYDFHVYGFPPSQFRQLRSGVQRASSTVDTGGSVTIDRYMLDRKLDPAYAAHAAPIAWWTAAYHDHYMPHGVLKRAFRGARTEMEGVANPWRVARGPASPVLATLSRLRWHPRDWNEWVDDRGWLVQLDELGPREMESLVRESTLRNLLLEHHKRATQSGNTESIPQPYPEPAYDLNHTKTCVSWTPRHRGSMRANVSGCLCFGGACMCGAAASVQHISWDCPCHSNYRREYVFPECIMAAASRMDGSIFWSQGLLLHPATGFLSPVRKDRMTWKGPPQLGAQAFGDGAGTAPTQQVRNRCGWGPSTISPEADAWKEHGAVCGPLPGLIQTAPAAELYAFWVFLRFAVPDAQGLEYMTDCQWVHGSWRKPWHDICDAWVALSVLWRRVRPAADDQGCIIRVLKAKAHMPEQEAATSSGKYQRAGHNAADRLPRMGSHSHPQQVLQDSIYERTHLVSNTMLHYLTRVTMQALECGTVCMATRVTRRRRSGLKRVRKLPTHDRPHVLSLHLHTGIWRCEACWSTIEDRFTLNRLPCVILTRPHLVFFLDQLLFCDRCGHYSSVPSVGLRGNCSQKAEATRLGWPKRMCKGLHPNHRVFLGTPKLHTAVNPCIVPPRHRDAGGAKYRSRIKRRSRRRLSRSRGRVARAQLLRVTKTIPEAGKHHM